MIGKARKRRPVAWNTALAMAAATPIIPVSPIPLTRVHETIRLTDKDDVELGDVRVYRNQLIAKRCVGDAAGSVEERLLEQPHTDAHYGGARDLTSLQEVTADRRHLA